MAVEFDTYMATDKRWFCHVDDDNYVNVPALVKLLRTYDHTQPWYIGKPSLAYPIKMSIGPFDQPKVWIFATVLPLKAYVGMLKLHSLLFDYRKSHFGLRRVEQDSVLAEHWLLKWRRLLGNIRACALTVVNVHKLKAI